MSVLRTTSRSAAQIAVIVVAVAVVVAVIGAAIPSLNPFRTETKDRSQPVVLKSLTKLSEYRASSANLQVVVDVEKDAKFLPSFIKGSKTLLVASGNVDGKVDFSRLDASSLKVSDDRRTATVTLPSATLSDARLDLEKTRVFDTDRGLLDRAGDVFGSGGADDERKLLRLAQQKLTAAPAADPQILRTAEGNTKAMLENLLRGLGFTSVTVRFARDAGT